MDVSAVLTGILGLAVGIAIGLAAPVLYHRYLRPNEPAETLPELLPIRARLATVGGPVNGETADPNGAVLEDDLTRIDGISAPIAAQLSEQGIQTFQQLADHQPEHLEQMLADAGMPVEDAGSWGRQAQLAAAGLWGELDELQYQERKYRLRIKAK